MRRPVKIVFTHEADDRSHASKYEYAIKKMTRKDKLLLINKEKELLLPIKETKD
jgi:predicted GIY-YIG superfamily endonuclease